MKTFLEEYGVIIVASIAILALVTIATSASGVLAEEVDGVITSFSEQIGDFSIDEEE